MMTNNYVLHILQLTTDELLDWHASLLIITVLCKKYDKTIMQKKATS